MVNRFIVLTDSVEKQYSLWSTYVRWFSDQRKKNFGKRISLLPSTEEYRRAEIALLLRIQQKYFVHEISQLEHNVQPKLFLDLFLDQNNLIRCKGRLQHSGLPYDTIHPILVPRKCRLTDLLMYSVHNQNCHVGAAHLLATLRTRFWVPKGRAKANSIVRRCAICRKLSGGAYKLPPMPRLYLLSG